MIETYCELYIVEHPFIYRFRSKKIPGLEYERFRALDMALHSFRCEWNSQETIDVLLKPAPFPCSCHGPTLDTVRTLPWQTVDLF